MTSFFYTIQAGDTLTKIAKAHGTTIENLAKLNNIKNPDKIQTGQKLIFEKKLPPVLQYKPEADNTGLDTFNKTEEKKNAGMSPYAPLAYGAAGIALCQVGKYMMPKAKNMAENAQLKYMYGKDAANKAVNSAAQKSKQTAAAVKTFVTQKAKHAAKSAELHYAFGKDAANKAVNSAAQKSKQTAASVKTFVTQKAKHAAKSAELHYAFGKDAANKTVTKTVKKGKVVTRYAKKIANTKIAPKIIKGASRYAAPAAALYGAYEIKQAYDKGGEKAAVKQAIKTGGGLAGGWAGAKAGAAIGSFAGPVGTVVGGIVGGVAGYILGEKIFS